MSALLGDKDFSVPYDLCALSRDSTVALCTSCSGRLRAVLKPRPLLFPDHPHLEPRHFVDEKAVSENHKDYMFLQCILFITEVRATPRQPLLAALQNRRALSLLGLSGSTLLPQPPDCLGLENKPAHSAPRGSWAGGLNCSF